MQLEPLKTYRRRPIADLSRSDKHILLEQPRKVIPMTLAYMSTNHEHGNVAYYDFDYLFLLYVLTNLVVYNLHIYV